MPVISTKQPKYNPLGDAKLRKQRQDEDLESIRRNRKIPVFMFGGFGYRQKWRATKPTSYNLEGPLCPKRDSRGNECFAELVPEGEKAVCEVCGFSTKVSATFEELRRVARKANDGQQRRLESGDKIQTLDVPYEAIKSENEDENRKIRIKWSQKDGRNMAVVYFIDKTNDGAKSQVFVDLDREELRYDFSDEHPGKVVAVLKAYFPETEVEIEYKKSD
jgi:hypothetical protein